MIAGWSLLLKTIQDQDPYGINKLYYKHISHVILFDLTKYKAISNTLISKIDSS